MGSTGAEGLFRFPAVVFSLLTLGLAVDLGRREHGPGGAAYNCFVFGLSYMLIHYGTEARGYSQLTFHGLLGYALLRQSLRAPPSSWRNAAFALNAVLGLLSQPVFAAFLLAAGLWSACLVLAASADRRLRLARDAAERLAPPLLVCALPGWLGLPLQSRGSGPEAEWWPAVEKLLQYGFGAPVGHAGAVLAVCALGVLVLLGRRRTNLDARFALLVLLALTPIAAVALSPDTPKYERYMLPALPFLYLLALDGTVLLAGRWPALRPLLALVLAGYALGQLANVQHFLADGRGQYRAALADIARLDARAIVDVGVDHRFRSGTVIDFHAPRLTPPRQFRPVRSRDLADQRPPWLLLHDVDDRRETASAQVHFGATTWNHLRTYRKFGPSGWHWLLYRRADLPPLP